ncbi:hypothetical protein [Natronobiforma cellulositropha]|uniref:hypothetical protein n=1 Tax=Natronobiforma cellulositropha TaxID=1679076 RepID=UPI0021D5A3C7|nr:hypothetical protein [Natronobiforma cellulositropha]
MDPTDELETGLTLLRVPAARSTVLHRLVCHHLERQRAPAYWIDARNTASTHALYECASTPRTLEGLEIARAFTAYQHHTLVREVARRADANTGLVVAPNVADPYAEVPDWERAELLAATLVTLRELGRALACPVVVTGTDEQALETVAEHATTEIRSVQTREGVRLEGERYRTAWYDHGTYWQTTIPYWVEVCGSLEEVVDPVVVAADWGLVEVA